MTEKQKTDEPKFVVKKRDKKAKPDFFANVTPFRHPVSDLLDFPTDDLDTQIEISGHSENKILDTQNIPFGQPSNKPSDTQTKNSGHSEDKSLDTQKTPFGQPNNIQSDTQTENSGHSDTNRLDAFAPEKRTDAPKKEMVLSAKPPKEKTLDTQKKYDYRKYEATRSTVRVNLHLDKSLDQRVREYCVKTDPRLELKEFFEMAALHFLDTQKGNGLSANAPLDDRRLIMYKTQPRIINLYLKFSGNVKWKMSDDAKASAYNKIESKFIELGILHTLGNRQGGGKINSFAYFIPEIDNWIESGLADETIETLVNHYKQRLGFVETEK